MNFGTIFFSDCILELIIFLTLEHIWLVVFIMKLSYCGGYLDFWGVSDVDCSLVSMFSLANCFSNDLVISVY